MVASLPLAHQDVLARIHQSASRHRQRERRHRIFILERRQRLQQALRRHARDARRQQQRKKQILPGRRIAYYHGESRPDPRSHHRPLINTRPNHVGTAALGVRRPRYIKPPGVVLPISEPAISPTSPPPRPASPTSCRMQNAPASPHPAHPDKNLTLVPPPRQ